jgi:GNAT superfamily N-acetyltransferase
MRYRTATVTDAHLLANMNAALIRDEGHRNPMTSEQLVERMAGFLIGGYEAAIFEDEDAALGYALFKREPDWVYVRQFYVMPENRRRGIGRKAVQWLRANVWTESSRVRIDVLVGNTSGIEFWRAVGFADYCLTMELDTATNDLRKGSDRDNR